MEKLRAWWGKRDIPTGVRMITVATSLRWLGWGFAESLIPVFIYQFGSSFAQAGLLKSGYDIAIIIALPIVGYYADRMRASTLILIGLCIYLFVGASYFLAGVTGVAIFIFIARFLNGAAFALDSTARGAYFRRSVSPEKTATIFGYFDTIADFWWIVAAFIGIVLIKYFPIHTLLFIITPTSALTMLIIWRFRKKAEQSIVRTHVESSRQLLREIAGWSRALKSVVVFNFFIAAAYGTVAFFLPIEAYRDGAPLSAVIVMGIVATTPTLFGWGFGKLFDARGDRMFGYGLLIFAVILLSLAYTSVYLWQVIAYFCINLVLELLSVGSNELITVHAEPEHFGRVDGIIKSITDIGMLVGPLSIGIAIDAYGVSFSYLTLAIFFFILAGIFYWLHKKGLLRKREVAVVEQ